MSVPSKSLDKNKRYAGVKANDFVNKARTNDVNRSTIRPQGWANLGKINSRRIPPPANVPSLKSEIGAQADAYDPPIPTSHGWTSTENQSSANGQQNPTQQQMDSLPMNSSAPSTPGPNSNEAEKPRAAPTWSKVTAGVNHDEPVPNLLAYNDFPRLATALDRKSASVESTTTQNNPSFRPANLSTWKEGGSSNNRIPSLMSDTTPMPLPETGANLMQQTNARMYPSSQMWTYQSYPAAPNAVQAQRFNAMNDYRSPTILRNKDIDDLSRLTDNTWVNASQEINYEEKIRFSDDEDETIRSSSDFDPNVKTRRNHPGLMLHSRLIRDDEHLKQMQDDKNSELINALTIAKQRRDEQERQIRNKSYDETFTATNDDSKQIPGYQTRPLMSVTEQDNYNGSMWKSNRDVPITSRTRHDTANSQTFSMKSWSDQMDSFNYASLHEKSGGQAEADEPSVSNHYNQSRSASSSPSPVENDHRTPKSKKVKSRSMQSKVSSKQFTRGDNGDHSPMNNNDQWNNWNDSKGDHAQRRQPNPSDKDSNKKPLSSHEQFNNRNKSTPNKTRQFDRQQNNSRPKSSSSTPQTHATTDVKSSTNKNSHPWHPQSPTRASESADPAAQEPMGYKSQQRYPMPLDTASIPPLMSVRSDPVPPGSLFKTSNHANSTHYPQRHEFYNEGNHDESGYYESNTQPHQRYPPTNTHSRGYTALGSYGRYRHSGVHRQQTAQQYSSYHHTSASGNNTGTRNKKNGVNRTSTNSSEHAKTLMGDEVITPLMEKQMFLDEPTKTKITEHSTPTPLLETKDSREAIQDSTDEKSSHMKNDNKSNVPADNGSEQIQNKTNSSSSTVKRNNNKDQQNFYQPQQAPRHRTNYSRSAQDYESMPVTSAHQYYGNNHRGAHPSRNPPAHESSTGYYYENSQKHYNNRYNYPNEQYQTSNSARSNSKKTAKRGGNSNMSNRPSKGRVNHSNNHNNNNPNYRHHSTSDNDQKEGEEWETASESSTNMRNGHYENNGANYTSSNNMKSTQRGRTPPKSFSSQRPHARQIFRYTNA